MSQMGNALKSSIFKKQFMAVTGLLLILFLFVHLLGNLNLILPPLAGDTSGMMFIKYAKALHSMPKAIILGAEIGLLVLFVIHIYTALTLWFKNRAARGPKGYNTHRNSGGRTLGSGTMIYTGLAILLFVVVHLINFTFSGLEPGEGVFHAILQKFHDPVYLGFYVIFTLILGVHISHGFQSAFQTFGWNSERSRGFITGLGMLVAFIIGILFAIIPVLVNAFYTL